MSKISARGYNENDKRWFSGKELIKLKKAKVEIEWLLDREYKLEPVVTFVGDRYQLSTRQRDALKRTVCTTKDKNIRNQKRLSTENISEGCINVDGFNLIITLEVALSGSTLIVGSDDNIRDLAGLRGTYRIIDKTDDALMLIGSFLNKYNCKEIKFYLDKPVSNSGNLKYKILKHSESWNIKTEVELVNNADVILEKLDRIVSSDAAIIDRCRSYFNMARDIVEENIKEANTINLNV